MKKLVLTAVISLMVLGLSLSMVQTVSADIDPPGATDNNLVLTIGRDAGPYHIGDTIYYHIRIEVQAWDEPNGFRPAAVTDVTVQFVDPALNACFWDSSDIPALARMDPGDIITIVAADWPCLSYVIAEADLQPDMSVLAAAQCDGTSWVSMLGDPAHAERIISTPVDAANPDLSIEKTVDFNGDGVYTNDETNDAGETASWKIVVCNTGDATVYNIVVIDTNGHDFGAPFDLNPGICRTFTYDMVMYMNTVNTACAEGMDEAGAPVGPVCDPAQVRILSHHVPTVSQWGMIGMAILFAALLIWSVRRRWLVSASRR